ncbi:MAG: hypothetical protein VR72_01555 [Clostridiaceae bacterium BRH_c20a]|nr:MAG: hypothetical protein VR72_01555 [Clostridiaceae bacterium BRH_c20a]
MRGKKKLLIGIGLVTIIVAFLFQSIRSGQNAIQVINDIIPGVTSFEKENSQYTVFAGYDEEKKIIGYGVITRAAGYAGPITVITGVKDDKIQKIKVLEQTETPWFFQRVISQGFLDVFKGKKIDEPFQINEDIDEIAGATITSQGITSAVRKGAHWIAENKMGVVIQKEKENLLKIEDFILVAIYCLVLTGITKRINKLRPLTLFLSFIFLGIWQSSPITFANITTILTGNAPAIFEKLNWHLLVSGTMLLTIIIGRNFYCNWMCPFGAIQEGFFRLAKFDYKQPYNLVRKAKLIIVPLVWFALVLGLLLNNPSISSYEPFSALFNLQANKAQWLLMPFVLFVGVFIYRFWCQFFCPVGLTLSLLSKTKGVIRQWYVIIKAKATFLSQ